MRYFFPEITDGALRSAIEQRLLLVEEWIPSLFTLFKDLRYLELVAKAMKALLLHPAKGSLC